MRVVNALPLLKAIVKACTFSRIVSPTMLSSSVLLLKCASSIACHAAFAFQKPQNCSGCHIAFWVLKSCPPDGDASWNLLNSISKALEIYVGSHIMYSFTKSFNRFCLVRTLSFFYFDSWSIVLNIHPKHSILNLCCSNKSFRVFNFSQSSSHTITPFSFLEVQYWWRSVHESSCQSFSFTKGEILYSSFNYNNKSLTSTHQKHLLQLHPCIQDPSNGTWWFIMNNPSIEFLSRDNGRSKM